MLPVLSHKLFSSSALRFDPVKVASFFLQNPYSPTRCLGKMILMFLSNASSSGQMCTNFYNKLTNEHHTAKNLLNGH